MSEAEKLKAERLKAQRLKAEGGVETPRTDNAVAVENRDWSGKSTVVWLLLVGAVLFVMGAAVIGNSWPSLEYDSFYEEMEPTGSAGDVAFGIVIAAVGQMCWLVAAIAMGVRIGNKT